jgi:hypothetical protein
MPFDASCLRDIHNNPLAQGGAPFVTQPLAPYFHPNQSPSLAVLEAVRLEPS